MKRFMSFFIIFLLTFMSTTFNVTAIASPDDKPAGISVEQFDLMPLAFTANHGQWDDRVQFKANAGGAAMWFTTDGVYYQFTRQTPVGQEPCAPDDLSGWHAQVPLGRDDIHAQTSLSMPPCDSRGRQMSSSAEQLVIKASFLGANPNPEIVGENMMEYKCNYFIGNDPDKWHTDVPNYKSVVLKDIYAGIDLKYFGNGKQMEYDFIVSPGADPNQIMVQYDGAKSISVNDDGELVVETEWGDVTELRPLVYQFDANGCMPIEGRYVIFNDNTFGFDLGDRYDPTLALVIDPTLEYSTYLGGSGTDKGNGIVVDSSGSAYVTGETYSTNFPTLNPFQTDQGTEDIFVTKFSTSGNNLVYSTYLGGGDVDKGYDIALDDSESVYLTGSTESEDFPVLNAFQITYQGLTDAFVLKLSSSGNSLIYSTYLGGSNTDIGRGVAVNDLGNAYLTGSTYSTDFPTLNPFQMDQDRLDAFVSKFTVSGSNLVYSTYLGGSSVDGGNSITVDNSSDRVYVTGSTYSTDFPTLNPYQGTYQGGFSDVFVTLLSEYGSSLVYSTYLGGSGDEEGECIVVDSSGHAYVTGSTTSTNFPIHNQYMTDQGGEDVFVSKFSRSGDSLIYSTYLGGDLTDKGKAIALDYSGAAYVTGQTGSTDFPTLNAYQTDQGDYDAFVARLNVLGDTLVYSTYLGGSGSEGCDGIAVDDSWAVYVTGETGSSDFPTLNPYQTDQSGGDVFITKLSPPSCVPGDADGSGAVDIDDVVYLINYIFGGGPAPIPMACCGDADGSGAIDIDDVVYLINYIFGGGPAPDPDACNPPW